MGWEGFFSGFCPPFPGKSTKGCYSLVGRSWFLVRGFIIQQKEVYHFFKGGFLRASSNLFDPKGAQLQAASPFHTTFQCLIRSVWAALDQKRKWRSWLAPIRFLENPSHVFFGRKTYRAVLNQRRVPKARPISGMWQWSLRSHFLCGVSFLSVRKGWRQLETKLYFDVGLMAWFLELLGVQDFRFQHACGS